MSLLTLIPCYNYNHPLFLTILWCPKDLRAAAWRAPGQSQGPVEKPAGGLPSGAADGAGGAPLLGWKWGRKWGKIREKEGISRTNSWGRLGCSKKTDHLGFCWELGFFSEEDGHETVSMSPARSWTTRKVEISSKDRENITHSFEHAQRSEKFPTLDSGFS